VLLWPDPIRARFAGVTVFQLVNQAAGLRPRLNGDTVDHLTLLTLRSLARRVQHLDGELDWIGAELEPLVVGFAPDLLAIFGVGVDTAATLLVAAGDNPGRLRSEAAWAHLCGVAPIPASSGKIVRHRLNRGGDRQANLGPAPRRTRPDEPPPRHPGLRHPPASRGPHQLRDHALPQALHRPRGLPGPPTGADGLNRSWRWGLTRYAG
jgi:transposase